MTPSVKRSRPEMPLRARAGWIAVILWIAALAALARWLYVSVLVVGLTASIVPRVLLLLIPLLLLYGFLRPKPKKVH